MRNAFLFLSAIFLGACSGANSNLKPLQVVDQVDIQRYLGTWYEIARYPNRFQKGCFNSKAEYSLRDDGDIKVVNSCNEDSPDGPIDSATGKAWVVDNKTNAKLKVRFFWPFSGDYWIIDLGKDYEYAVVGDPDRDYLWILSRNKELEQKTYEGILFRLAEQGYDPVRLIKS